MTGLSHPTPLLNDGDSIPALGLRVWHTPAEETEESRQAVAAALATGHRQIDTAARADGSRNTHQNACPGVDQLAPAAG
jgi:diketogulonate reductase-like aldo/keto reductase